MKIKKRYLQKIKQNIKIKLSEKIYLWIGKKYRMIEIKNDSIGFIIIGYYYIDSDEIFLRTKYIEYTTKYIGYMKGYILKMLMRFFNKNISILAENCILFNKMYPGIIEENEDKE